MATKNTPPLSEVDAQKPTPGNTPVPGGGSWRWDDDVPGWVGNDPYTPPPIVTGSVPDAALPDAAPGLAS